jgi:phospholipase C
MPSKRATVLAGVLAVVSACFASCNSNSNGSSSSAGIHKIKHIVIVMQENRSFDNYFGTYPGADGIPMRNGVPTVCVPDPRTAACVKPYHDARDRDRGGPHAAADAIRDIDGNKMDGFIESVTHAQNGCITFGTPICVPTGPTNEPDVVGYHDAREIPNYWTYARNFVLQDRMFQPNATWSLPAHLFIVSE